MKNGVDNMKDITFKYENIKFDYRVAAIIENNNRFLLQKMKQDDAYTLVGGRVTLLTTSKESLIRELKEEINLNVTQKDLKLLEIAENFFDYKDENEALQKVHSILFIYKVNVSNEEDITKQNGFSVLDKQKTKLYWVPKQELKNELVLPKLVKRFIDDESFSYNIIDDCTNRAS